MANKSLPISSGYNRLMRYLALPLLARPQYRKEQRERSAHEAINSEPAFPIWPDIPTRAMDPHERMRVDAARLYQATMITSIR